MNIYIWYLLDKNCMKIMNTPINLPNSYVELRGDIHGYDSKTFDTIMTFMLFAFDTHVADLFLSKHTHAGIGFVLITRESEASPWYSNIMYPMYMYVCNASAEEMHQAWFYTHTLPTVLDTKLCTGHAYTCVISMNMIWGIFLLK